MGTQRKLSFLGIPSIVLALLIPCYMPTAHVCSFSPMLLTRSSLVFGSSRTLDSYPSLISYWFWLMLVTLFSYWFILFLKESQWQLTGWIAKFPPSPYNPVFFHTQFAVLASCWSLASLTICPWRWWWYVPLKCQLPSTGLHSFISQKTELCPKSYCSKCKSVNDKNKR
jgi:hypothetical protein